MAINPETKYPGQIAPSSADYPYGAARNVTVSGDGKGTPWEKDLINDVFGWQQSLLSSAGITPSGTPEKATASQYMDASNLLAIARSLNIDDSAIIFSTDTTTVLDNVSYIYDVTAQTTWAVPALDSAGKTIVSVVGSALTTTGGTGGNSYTLIGITVTKQVYLQDFGGVADYNEGAGTGTDNQAALERAENYCSANGCDLIIAGKFGVGSATTHKSIKHLGVFPGGSGLYALNDAHRIYTWDAGDTTGKAVFKDIILHGYADRNTTQGGDESAIIEISPIDEVVFDNVEFAYSRQMSCKSRATRSTATGCYVHHSLRDGINFTDSQYRIVTGNRVKYCADDAIACHSNSSNVFTESTITDNQLYNTYGIKNLSHKATIANNRGELIFGYGVYYGSDGTEGNKSSASISVNNNTFINIINATNVGGGNVGAGVFSDVYIAANANGFYPNEYDTTANQFVDPLVGLEENLTSSGSIGTFGINVNNNNILQTWTGGTNISDYGQGDQAWTTSGFSDIALTGTLGKDSNVVYAYRFDSVVDGVSCLPGSTYGTTNIYLFQNMLRFNDSYFGIGSAARIYDKAISVVKDASLTDLHCSNSQIRGGSIDMDPLHEHPDRELISGEPTGSWTNTGSSNSVGISCTNIKGLLWEKTTVKNMQKIAHISGGGATTPIVRDLVIYAGDDVGVGSMTFYRDHERIFIDADPRNATYGEILQGNLSQRNTLPTSGYYFQGQTINNSNYASTIGGNTFSKIFRLTTGNGHVLNTDWGIVPLTTS